MAERGTPQKAALFDFPHPRQADSSCAANLAAVAAELESVWPLATGHAVVAVVGVWVTGRR